MNKYLAKMQNLFKHILVVIFVGLTTINIAFSQNDYAKMAEVLPPSPNAASLGKFGGITPSISTGAMSHTVPLYEYTSRAITLPISINYFSDGVKIDEIASRAGTSWNLIAGGVITHTVMGKNDLTSIRAIPPSTYPQRNRDLMTFFENISTSTENGSFVDGEPDLFSFNFQGMTGQFILDQNKVPILLSHSNLKIEWFDTDKFKVTDAQGVQYYFGEGNSIERSNKLSAGADCGKIFHNTVITAWYLSKIIHPNRDTLWLDYENIGYSYKAMESESIYARDYLYNFSFCAYYTTTAPNLSSTKCETYLQVTNSLLKEIRSSAGPKIKLTYISRNDVGDKLVSILEVQDAISFVPFKYFDFTYQTAVPSNRPFLTALTERSPEGLKKDYYFFYNDMNALPPLLSYSKDHYGYFNGKNNTTLIPRPVDLVWQQKLPLATADREPDETYSIKGMLCKIVYPTGGNDTVFYSGNKRYISEDVLPPTTNISQSVFSIQNPGQTSASQNFVISYEQQCILSASCIFEGTSAEVDPLHNLGTLSVTNTSTGSIVFSRNNILPGEILNEVLLLCAGNYTFTIAASGNKVRMGGTVICRIGNKTTQLINKFFSGVRVEKVITNNNFGNPEIRKFIYAKLQSPNNSSFTVPVWEPQYTNLYKVIIPCSSGQPNSGNSSVPNCDLSSYQYYSMNSNTINNIYLYASPVAYSDVIESFGENYENGGVEHQLLVRANLPGPSITGDYILGAPLTNNSWISGKEIYTNYFKKDGSVYKSTKKVFTNYKEDNRIDNIYKAYVVNKKYAPPCMSEPPNAVEQGAWDCQEYFHFQKWLYIDKVTTQTFDGTGLTYVEDISLNEYGNIAHAMQTKLTIQNSDGSTKVINNKYPQDLILTGTQETARQNLISKHIISPILEQLTTNGSVDLVNVKNDYLVYPSTLVLPQAIQVGTKSNPLEKRMEFLSYSQFGKLLEQSKINNVKSSYIWSYNYQYPVVQVVGADYTTVVSFINQTILDNPLSTDADIRAELNKIRTGLVGTKALVTTYTYKPLVGITSQTDPNGRTTYYQYDAFGRLQIIKDQDGKILKKICYNYAGQPEDCSINLTAVWAATGNLRCATSGGNNTGYQEREEKDNNPNSPTYNQTQWVTNGYNTGSCPLPAPPCTFSISSGFGMVTSNINSSDGTVSFYMVFYPFSTMQPGNSYYVAMVNGGCRPSTTRTISYSSGGRNWSITIYPSGQMYWYLSPGSTSISSYSSVGTSTLTYNL